MKYDIVVKKLSQVPERLVNCWVVEVTQMSGDADAFNHVEWKFTNEFHLKDFVNFALAIKKADEYAYGSFRKIDKILKEELDEEMYNRNISILSEITGYDTTRNDGTLAGIDVINIHYYDSYGIKYDCEIVENE